jgi:predicted SnoaL-like aldol condensation-catalyzing enzyme
MSKEDCKATVRRLWDEGFNQGNWALLDEICGAELIAHDLGLPEAPPGPEGMRQLLATYRRVLPDARVRLDEIFGQEGKLVASWSAEGMALTGIAVYRFERGKIVESWSRLEAPSLTLDVTEA